MKQRTVYLDARNVEPSELCAFYISIKSHDGGHLISKLFEDIAVSVDTSCYSAEKDIGIVCTRIATALLRAILRVVQSPCLNFVDVY